jgi:hypothetical protein
MPENAAPLKHKQAYRSYYDLRIQSTYKKKTCAGDFVQVMAATNLYAQVAVISDVGGGVLSRGVRLPSAQRRKPPPK